MSGSSFWLAFFVASFSGFAGASCAKERAAPSNCGNGTLDPDEACDDGNTKPGDGCDALCAVQLGYSCEGVPSSCTPICGDGLVRGRERCDEGPPSSTSGCSRTCEPRLGFTCMGQGPGSCRPTCGDGRVLEGEACDDGNVFESDGCSSTCTREDGFDCMAVAPTTCVAICGDGRVLGEETCDDGNVRDGDGCSSSCVWRLRWRPIPNTEPPAPRMFAASVWTGEEMFVWSGASTRGLGQPVSGFLGYGLSDGGLYHPRTGIWRAVDPFGAPPSRALASAVWTGAEVLVWGGTGSTELGDGGRFDPVANTWRAMSQREAPSPRREAPGVWTGSEFIVFGGRAAGVPVAGGGAYDPSTDSWRPLATLGAPSPRLDHSVVWTGTKLIVFGGVGASGAVLGDGASYDPASDRWTPLPLTHAPTARRGHTAVWTGTEMIVFGGNAGGTLATGGAYDPARNVWRPIAAAEESAQYHVAVWTGSEMIVVGAYPNGRPAKYLPAVDAWVPLPSEGAPSSRASPLVSLTPQELLVFGGFQLDASNNLEEVRDGGRFDLRRGTWSPFPSGAGSESSRSFFAAVAQGSEIFVWGGDAGNTPRGTGARMDVVSGARRALPLAGAPSARRGHSGVATERALLIWGGGTGPDGLSALGDGASYDFVEDRWSPLPMDGAPSPRTLHISVFTGTEMIIWGGTDGESLGDGARLEVESGVWRPMDRGPDAPSPRTAHSGVWTGTELIIWGGASDGAYLGTGARYDPTRDRWTPLPLDGAPTPRAGHRAVWTGAQMIVWGGLDGSQALNTGARYIPAEDRWIPLPVEGAPSPRHNHSATWSGVQMIVFGGIQDVGASVDRLAADGARYDPLLDAWLPLPTERAPSARAFHSALWMGTRLVVWGGRVSEGAIAGDGAILDVDD